MLFRRHLIALAVLGPPVAALAQSAPNPAHGGLVQKAVGHLVELVVDGDRMTVYVTEPDSTPLATKDWSAKATVLANGKSENLTLEPSGPNSASGKLGSAAGVKYTAVLSLTIDGKPGQARFASAP